MQRLIPSKPFFIDLLGGQWETKYAPEGAYLMVLWRPRRDCINNSLSFLTPFFWWNWGFELNARQNRATEESKPPH